MEHDGRSQDVWSIVRGHPWSWCVHWFSSLISKPQAPHPLTQASHSTLPSSHFASYHFAFFSSSGKLIKVSYRCKIFGLESMASIIFYFHCMPFGTHMHDFLYTKYTIFFFMCKKTKA
jgi:hypothetical protein